MNVLESGPVLAMVGLGALHGVNPAMGWLFATALGLQERRSAAVWRALPPLALGHALSVGVFAAAAALAGAVLSGDAVRLATAALLLAVGVHRIMRGHMHSRFGGMRASRTDLVAWSFLMATAHGAGLMVLPFLPVAEIGSTAAHAHAGHVLHGSIVAGQSAGLAATLVHTVSYLVTAGIVAVVVYERAGVRLLRSAWINLDVVWAAALIVTALVLLIPLAGSA
jgi:hypothetical protein